MSNFVPMRIAFCRGVVPKRPRFGPIVSHDDVSHDKLGVKNDNSPQKIHARQEPITLCKGNLSEKSVVLIAPGFCDK